MIVNKIVLPGAVSTPTRISIVRSTGDIRLDIFLAGPKNTDGGNIFRFMKLEESMAREDSEPEEMCSELTGTHFTIRKIIFRQKFRSSKGPELD
jgi:hypothetical protein